MTPTTIPNGIDLAFTALLAQRLAVIAGAGLSMAAPSHLPSAWKLAERAKTEYGLQWGASKPPLSDDIEAQAEFFFAHNELQTVYLATLIDRHAFAGRPNPGHLAIADLMLSHTIQTVVTTNVDVLVETAGNELFGQIEAGIDGVDVAALPPDAVPMLEIHGCRHADWLNTVWAPSQLTIEPVLGKVASSIPWISQRLLNRDLLIVGYWTDWDYLNQILTQAMNATNPSRVIVVDPADAATFPTKAPALFDLGQRAANGFYHVKVSGADFLMALRRKFSDYIVRAVLHSGAAAYIEEKGVAPDPAWLERPAMDDTQSWLLRRDLLGCAPNAPAVSRTPPRESNEETLFVKIGVDKPGSDALGIIRPNFSGFGVEHVHAIHPHPDFRAAIVEDFDVRLAEYDEHIAAPGVLQFLRHVHVRVDPCALRILRLPRLANSDEWASKLKAQAINTSKRASTASRAAATRSRRPTVPYSGPIRIAARRSGPFSPSINVPHAPMKLPGQGAKLSNVIRSPLTCCLTPSAFR